MATPDHALSQDVMAELEQRLRAARRVLLQTVSATDVELKTLEEREVGAPIEDAAREEGLGILARLEDRELEELREITAALRRIAQGQYGVCEGCGARIPVERLRARPAARLCVPCQSRWEGPSGGGARGSGGRAP